MHVTIKAGSTVNGEKVRTPMLYYTVEEEARQMVEQGVATWPRVLGHTFRPMERSDWDAFSGCDEGTMINTEQKDVILFLTPDGTVVELEVDGEEQREWILADIARVGRR